MLNCDFIINVAGLDLANLLIKKAAGYIGEQFSSIKFYSTLSPIPQFVSWLAGPSFNVRMLCCIPSSTSLYVEI